MARRRSSSRVAGAGDDKPSESIKELEKNLT
jgi:hypothetical protein